MIPGWVAKVKNHPALYGYLSVKEPSWNRISLSRDALALHRPTRRRPRAIRSSPCSATRPHFGTSANPWGTRRGERPVGRLVSGHDPPRLPRERVDELPEDQGYVAATTPGTPIWLMVQGHAYKAGDLRTPTAAELRRQVSDGFRYLGAAGIAFYTWQNPLYSSDFKRNPALWDVAESLMVTNVGEVVVDRARSVGRRADALSAGAMLGHRRRPRCRRRSARRGAIHSAVQPRTTFSLRLNDVPEPPVAHFVGPKTTLVASPTLASTTMSNSSGADCSGRSVLTKRSAMAMSLGRFLRPRSRTASTAPATRQLLAAGALEVVVALPGPGEDQRPVAVEVVPAGREEDAALRWASPSSTGR